MPYFTPSLFPSDHHHHFTASQKQVIQNYPFPQLAVQLLCSPWFKLLTQFNGHLVIPRDVGYFVHAFLLQLLI